MIDQIERPKSLTAMAFEKMRQAIIDATFPFGTPLSESVLAGSLGISKTPVREALVQLQAQGLVTVVPQKGTFVFSPSAEQVAEICDFRIALESWAIPVSHRRGRAALLRDLKAIVVKMAAARKAGDLLGYFRLDERFHECFIDHCGNRIVRDAYDLIAGQAAALRTQLSAPYPEASDKSYREHRAMLSHLEQDRVPKVLAMLEEHIGRTKQLYQARILRGDNATPHRRPRRQRPAA